MRTFAAALLLVACADPGIVVAGEDAAPPTDAVLPADAAAPPPDVQRPSDAPMSLDLPASPCPAGQGILDGTCTPSCATAGGNTCSSILGPCERQALFISYDCRFCCNVPTEPPPPDPPAGCAMSASGASSIWTCTADRASRQRCNAGATQTEACAHGCVPQPAGVDDYCATASCAGSASGSSSIWTCTADRTARQRCVNGATQTERCAQRCEPEPLGVDDVCASAGCAGSASGSTSIWTCTADHMSRQRCVGGATQTEACPAGCAARPLGTDDVCNPSCAGSASGTSAVWTCTADHAARQRCVSGAVQTERCPSGCLGRPLGTDDVCATGCAGSASGTSPVWTCTGDFTARERCVSGAVQSEACAHGCVSQPPGVDDICGSGATTGSGQVSCGYPQWWTAPYSWNPGYYAIHAAAGYRWDNDLAITAGTPIQLRHDSQLVTEDVWPWGWMPQFIDQATGEHFAFLHLQTADAQRLTRVRGHVYPAGTLVGYSGGNTAATGLCVPIPGCGTPICSGPSAQCVYSTGAHLCVQTVRSFHTAFPATRDACR